MNNQEKLSKQFNFEERRYKQLVLKHMLKTFFNGIFAKTLL